MEAELKLCSHLLLVVGAALGWLGGCRGQRKDWQGEGDRKEARGIDLVPGRIFH